MLKNRRFGIFHCPLVTATQISSAMDCESRDVLMPEVRLLSLFLPEKISERKSTKQLGGEMTPEFKKLLRAAMASPENYYMQLGYVDGILKQSLLKFDFLKLQLQMHLQLLLLYPDQKSTLAHFSNLVAKMLFVRQRNLPFFL